MTNAACRGVLSGVNKKANIIPLKVITDVVSYSVRNIIRAQLRILARQRANRNKVAVASISFNFLVTGLRNNPHLVSLPPTSTDPFGRILSELNNAGVIVLTASGNDGSKEARQGQIPFCTPPRWGGTNSNLIVVGSSDYNGFRSWFSSARDDAGVGYVSVYSMGNGVFAGSVGTSSYRFGDGTSHATAAASGLMSILVGQYSSITPFNAKVVLQNLAIAKKGSNWPSDPYSILPGAPRLANNVEIPCTPSANSQVWVPSFVWYDPNPSDPNPTYLINPLPLPSPYTYTDYLTATSSVRSHLCY
jgi:hypothetical protein